MTTLVIDIVGCKHFDELNFSKLGEFKILSIPAAFKGFDFTQTESNLKIVSEHIETLLTADNVVPDFIVLLVQNKKDEELFIYVKQYVDQKYPNVGKTVLAEKLSLSEEASTHYADIFYYRQESEFLEKLKTILYSNTILSKELVSELFVSARTENTLTIDSAFSALELKKTPALTSPSFYNAWGLLWNINK